MCISAALRISFASVVGTRMDGLAVIDGIPNTPSSFKYDGFYSALRLNELVRS